MEKRPANSLTGGNPSGLPDYKPINKLSPAELARTLMPVRPSSDRYQPWYQVWVDDKAKGLIPVGPKCPKETAEACCAALKKNILVGGETQWGSPVVVRVGGGPSFA